MEISGRDIILLGGGLFLIAKSTLEIHNALEVLEWEQQGVSADMALFAGTLVQIILIDIVFFLDSVITAVGMVQHIRIMILAIIIALIGEGLDLHIPKGYIYFAMAFSCLVELLNMRIRKPETPVKLQKQIIE